MEPWGSYQQHRILFIQEQLLRLKRPLQYCFKREKTAVQYYVQSKLFLEIELRKNQEASNVENFKIIWQLPVNF